MGITTRIETERLGLFNMGFEHLADEVTTLGENISKKAKEVQSSIRMILGFVKVNQTNLVSLRTKHQGLQLSVAKNLNEDLQLLSEKHEVLVNVVENINRQSQDSVHSVNTIVGAIQFHDITRQQIEHVVEALRDLHTRLTEGGNDDPMSYLILVCELQPAQLQRARFEFMNAILSLISSFGNLSNTVDMMQAESREAIGFADGDGSTFFNVIGSNLQNVTKALVEGERGIHEFLNSLEQIETVVDNMKKYMDEMSEAGDEVELLALNSRVRAAKTRERGAALGVIAESIQRISIMAEIHITEVVRNIGALVEKTDAMHELAKNAEISRTTESSIDDMTQSLRVMIDEFASSGSLGKTILEQAAYSSGLLSKELEAMAATVRENRLVGDALERVERRLASIGRDARAEAPEFVIAEVGRRLEEMNDRYTMYTERDTHAAYVGGTSGTIDTSDPSGGSVELF
jgi:methyl-accepting chemotaxis protein